MQGPFETPGGLRGFEVSLKDYLQRLKELEGSRIPDSEFLIAVSSRLTPSI
jgi:hypothetical protein